MDVSDLPAETPLLTELGCPMANLTAIQSLPIEGWDFRSIASCALRASLFFKPDTPNIEEGSPRWRMPSRRTLKAAKACP